MTGDAPKPKQPLVFISHDSRDAELAEKFAELVADCSAGFVATFRSTDRSSAGGIEPGADWYQRVMSRLDDATDVVALLTPVSVGRPWILYEVGVAKGKLDCEVHGVAIGIPLAEAATGPISQFQNSDDSEEGLMAVMRTLIERAGAPPREEGIRHSVLKFRDWLESHPPDDAQTEPKEQDRAPTDLAVVYRLFEEIKGMFRALDAKSYAGIMPLPIEDITRTASENRRLMEVLQQHQSSGLSGPDGVGV